MKYAVVGPVSKQVDKTEMENYIPVSILPTLGKVNPDIVYDVSQGSILELLLLNICIRDLFVDTKR